VVTVMSTLPAAVAAGLVAFRTVEDTNCTLVAAPAVTKLTVAAAVNPVPVMVTTVPPAVGPAGGGTPVIVGSERQVNWSPSALALLPRAVVTVMSTLPAAVAAGLVAFRVVELTNCTLVAAPAVTKLTVAPAVNSVPVMVTTIP